jgi:tetratricopeptide (TPR) repeat protein
MTISPWRKVGAYLAVLSGSAYWSAAQLSSNRDFSWKGAIEDFPLWISTAPNPTLLLTTTVSAVFSILGFWGTIIAIRTKPASLADLEEDGSKTRALIENVDLNLVTSQKDILAAISQVSRNVSAKIQPPKGALDVIRSALREDSLTYDERVLFTEVYKEFLTSDAENSAQIINYLVEDIKSSDYQKSLEYAVENLSGNSRISIIKSAVNELEDDSRESSAKYTHLATLAGLDDPKLSMELLNRSLTLDANNTLASIRLAFMLIQYATIAEARECIEGAINNVSDSAQKIDLHLAFANILRMEGNTSESKGEILKGLAIAERELADRPRNHQFSHGISALNILMGDMQLISGDNDGAKASFDSAVVEINKLKDADHYCRASVEGLSGALSRLGNLERSLGRITLGIRYLEDARAVLQDWLKRAPLDVSIKRDLAIGLQHMGEAYIELGDHEGGKTLLRQGLVEIDEMIDLVPGGSQILRDKAIALNSLGEIELYDQNFGESESLQLKALEINKHLSDSDASNYEAKRDLSITFERLGDIYKDTDSKLALSNLEEALKIRNFLHEFDPNNLKWYRDVSVIIKKIGVIYDDMGNYTKSMSRMSESLEIDSHLYRLDENNPERAYDLSDTMRCAATSIFNCGNHEKAYEFYSASASMARDLSIAYPEVARFAEHAASTEALIARLFRGSSR